MRLDGFPDHASRVVVADAVRQALRRLRVRRAEVACRAVGAAESRRLNARFRGKRKSADILTFAAPPADGGAAAEICLCLPLIRRRAARLRRPAAAWLRELAVHGVLHALGWHHDGTRAGAEMFALQRALAARR